MTPIPGPDEMLPPEKEEFKTGLQIDDLLEDLEQQCIFRYVQTGGYYGGFDREKAVELIYQWRTDIE